MKMVFFMWLWASPSILLWKWATPSSQAHFFHTSWSRVLVIESYSGKHTHKHSHTKKHIVSVYWNKFFKNQNMYKTFATSLIKIFSIKASNFWCGYQSAVQMHVLRPSLFLSIIQKPFGLILFQGQSGSHYLVWYFYKYVWDLSTQTNNFYWLDKPGLSMSAFWYSDIYLSS